MDILATFFVTGAEYPNTNTIPAKRVGIVFGSLVYPNRALSPILKNRVDAAIELYRHHRIQKILMSGDNSQTHYDEVTAMKEYTVKHGVPTNDITVDYAGYTTYDSCYRAHTIFNV